MAAEPMTLQCRGVILRLPRNMRGIHAANRARYCRAMSFIEMMVALVILSILSLAVCVMTFGAMNADRFSRSAGTAQSEVELGIRRIINNIREAQTVTLTGSAQIQTLTQADAAHGYAGGATVTYSLAADAGNAAQNDLMENDQRYGNNVLIHNVTSFSVTQVSGTTNEFQVDLVAGGMMTVERHIKVFMRN